MNHQTSEKATSFLGITFAKFIEILEKERKVLNEQISYINSTKLPPKKHQ